MALTSGIAFPTLINTRGITSQYTDCHKLDFCGINMINVWNGGLSTKIKMLKI